MGSFSKIHYGHPLFFVGTKRYSKRRADDRLGSLSHKKSDAMFHRVALVGFVVYRLDRRRSSAFRDSGMI